MCPYITIFLVIQCYITFFFLFFNKTKIEPCPCSHLKAAPFQRLLQMLPTDAQTQHQEATLKIVNCPFFLRSENQQVFCTYGSIGGS